MTPFQEGEPSPEEGGTEEAEKEISSEKPIEELSEAVERKSQEKTIYDDYDTVTDRNFNEYKEDLGFSPEQLKNKLVLDIGSGQREKFAREARRKGIRVVSLNPELKEEDIRRYHKSGLLLDRLRGIKRESVAGIAQQLPFKENTFNVVLSNYGVPFYLYHLPDRKSALEPAFREIIRVLKPGGRAYLYPATLKRALGEDFRDDPLQSVLKNLGDLAEVKVVKRERPAKGSASPVSKRDERLVITKKE